MSKIKDAPAAIKRTLVIICGIALWPLLTAYTKLKKAGRISVRWAIRKRHHAMYLAMVFWPPILSFGCALWAAIAFRPPGNAILPWLMEFNKWLFVITAFGYGLNRMSKSLAHYRRRKRAY